MMSKAKVARVIVLLAVLAGGGIWAARSKRQARADERAIRGSGTVEATEIDVAAETVGRILDLKVDDGDRVTRGQVIAVLKRDQMESELRRSEAAAETARMQLRDLENGSRPEEIRGRAARLREALANLDTARRAARTAQDAYWRPHEHLGSIEAAQSRYQGARAATQQARAAHLEARNGPREQEIRDARAAVAQADEGIRAAQAALGQADEALKGSQAELPPVRRATAARTTADTQVAQAETRLAAATEALRQAEARRDQVIAEPRPKQRDQLNRRIENNRAALVLAEQTLDRDQRLYTAGAIPKKQLEASLTGRDRAQAALREAEAALADLDAGARQPERREAEAAVARAQAELRGAKQDLANARHEQSILVATAQQSLERAGSAVSQGEQRRHQAAAALQQAHRQRDQAQARLDLLLAGTRSERVAQTAAGVDSARATESGARDALRRAQLTTGDRFALRQQLETARGNLSAARSRVEAAQADLDLAVAGNTREKIGAARGQVAQAEAARDTASSKLDDTVILAPRSGTITEVILREGETVSPGSVVVRMLDLERLWVRIFLPVRHFGKVVRGQGAAVTADAFPGKRYDGTVLTVSDSAEFTPKNTQTVEERVKQVFWVKVGVGNGQGELKPGLPADVVLAVGARG